MILTTSGAAVADQLRAGAVNISYTNEIELQDALATVLGLHPLEREVPLTDGRSRIDMVVTDLLGSEIAVTGVEVKVDGSLADVLRQLHRYAGCTELDELVLVTTRSKHHRIPATIGARQIPLHLVSLVENGL